MNNNFDPSILLKKTIAGSNLDKEEIYFLFNQILEGRISDALTSAFLVSLSMKGESPTEITYAIESIKNHAINIIPSSKDDIIDLCGTGGDAIKSFNISTAASIVSSACGIRVAKHGNRSFTGYCGSADFFESIGYNLENSAQNIADAVDKISYAFIFAPNFHPALKNVSPVRKVLGIRTLFNIIGPLSNPCRGLSGQLIGLYEPKLLEKFAEVILLLNKDSKFNAMLVHAYDGMDELSNTCENDIVWINNGNIKRLRLNPKITGMEKAKIENIVVRSREESIRYTLQSISGTAPRDKEDIVLLNAAAANMVGGISDDFSESIDLARQAVKSGKAEKKLFELVRNYGDVTKLERLYKIYFKV